MMKKHVSLLGMMSVWNTLECMGGVTLTISVYFVCVEILKGDMVE